MNGSFERIEKHLYKRRYQTAGGEWSTLYHARFKDWKGRQRAFPLGIRAQDRARWAHDLRGAEYSREDFTWTTRRRNPNPSA